MHLAPTSHELLEWLDNPLIFGVSPKQYPLGLVNKTFGFAPMWSSPFYEFGCAQIYEVADPLEEGPSIGFLTGPASICSPMRSSSRGSRDAARPRRSAVSATLAGLPDVLRFLHVGLRG